MTMTTTAAAESEAVDQPLTPAGRLMLQPKMDQVINAAIALEHSFDVDTCLNGLRNSLLVKHPRFRSLYVRDERGNDYWRRTEMDLDRHVIVHPRRLSEDVSVSDSDAVNDFLADLSVSSPLATDKPLWEVHALLAHKAVVFRFHHALGDGISLMSLLLDCCRRADDPATAPSITASPPPRRRPRSLWTFFLVVWYTAVSAFEFFARLLWLRDETTVISGGDGVELWPRRLATARFRLEDMKIVKSAVDNATINDVLFGVISLGLSRYLHMTSPKALREGLQLTGMALVNLRSQSGLQDISKLIMNSNSETRWGNQIGTILLPIFYHDVNSDPIQFVRRAKAMIDKKKLSLEAPVTYKFAHFLVSRFGPKVSGDLNYKVVCSTTFTLSNIVGPKDKITLENIPVSSIKVTSSSLAHSLTMHMVSYAGMAEMQILVAKEIIPDPKLLAHCFEEALLQMKRAVRRN